MLERLDCAIVPAADALESVPVRCRVFYRNPRHRCIQECPEQVAGVVQVCPQVPLGQPTNAAQADSRAGRVSYQQVPAFLEDHPGIPLNVEPAAIFGRIEVAGPCLMPTSPEGFAHYA
jgi:hypothetical protein